MSPDPQQNSNGVPPHFIVIVPGYMGSRLRDTKTGELIWIDFSTIPINPLKWDDWLDNLFTKMEYPNEDLQPDGIVDEVVFVPPWAKQEQYGRLVIALEKMGYRADPQKYSEEQRNLYTFSYDWRQDNRISGRQLGEAVERWSNFHPGAKAWLIAHSNGGIVSRWYIEKEGGKDKVGKLFLMGSPWDGAPKAVRMLYGGLDSLFRRGFNLFNIQARTRDLIRTFPSAYQLIPVVNPFLHNANNEVIDIFSGQGWINKPEHLTFLQDAKKFNLELGTELSVETLCFFGRKLPTTTAGMVRLQAGGDWSGIDWAATEAGDGTVPERSAVNPNAQEKLPFLVSHGDIYVNPSVLEILQWELMDKYMQGIGLAERAAITTQHLSIVFEPSEDGYSPGDSIDMWAEVQEIDGTQVKDAKIQVQMVWREALPGEQQTEPSGPLPKDRLWPDEQKPGRYEGSLQAPDTQGYYLVRAIVNVQGESPVVLDEMIIVEALPELS